MATAKTAKPVVFKEGQKVKVVKTGIVGKIITIRENNGQWFDVDFGDKKNPLVRSVRPKAVVKA